MKLNFLTKSQDKTTDPVCLMKVTKDPKTANYKYKEKIYSQKSSAYYFCSENCKEQFKQDPEKYL